MKGGEMKGRTPSWDEERKIQEKKKKSGGCCGSTPEFSPSPFKYV
jgi:hypothetical protein